MTRAYRTTKFRANQTKKLPDGARRIHLRGGLYTVVSEEDYPRVRHLRWTAHRAQTRVYATAALGGKSVYLHRLLMDFPPGFTVDHIDGDGLNNRRENLRIASQVLNTLNARRRRATRRNLPVGVRLRRRRFSATLKLGKRLYHLGSFPTPDQAARAYQEVRQSAIRNQARLDQEAYLRARTPHP